MSDLQLIEQFNRDGYIAIPNAFNFDEVAKMQREADAMLELIINSSIAHSRRSGRLSIVESEQGEQMAVKIQPVNDLSLYLAAISVDERLLGPMRTLMADEPILMEEKLNYKQPLSEPVSGFDISGRRSDGWGMHSDWAYYKAQDYPQTIISSAICLDDCTAENGPLHIWPGTHKEHLPHQQSEHGGLVVEPGSIDSAGGNDLLVPAGTILLFSSLLIHNSRPNTSGNPRRLMIYSHYPQTADMGVDVRNGPSRLREAPYEWEYIRMRERGEAQVAFNAPTH